MFNTNALTNLSSHDRSLFQSFGAGSSSHVKFDCIHHAFEHHAQRRPFAIAVEHASVGESITYRDLDIKANRLARRLREQGVAPGERVCILSKRSITHVIAVLAVLKAGGQYVPLDAESITDNTLAHVLWDSEAVLLLTMEAYIDRPSSLPKLCLEEVIAEDEGRDGSKVEDLSQGSDGIYVIYTSGTTGLPKGVDVTHSNVTNLVLQSPGNVGMRPGMRVAQLLNIAFDMGAWELLGAMANGCTLCLRGDRSKHWKAVLATVDVVISTPTMLERHDPRDYPNIKHVITAGEPCPQALADRWALHTNFYNSCGPTEITIINTAQHHAPGDKLSIGTPIPNTSVYILDEDAKPLAIGKVGLMWVGGAGVSRGYVNLPEKTAEKYRRDPFLNDGRLMYNTGDLCRWRDDGRIDVLGRSDEQVKVKGFRVELDGVTAAMRTCDRVTRATTLLVDSELWGFYSPSNIPWETVRSCTAKILPSYAVPSRYMPLSDLPITRNGKVDKNLLRALAEETMSEESLPTSPELPDLESCPSSPDVSDQEPVTPHLTESPVFREIQGKRLFVDTIESMDTINVSYF